MNYSKKIKIKGLNIDIHTFLTITGNIKFSFYFFNIFYKNLKFLYVK